MKRIPPILISSATIVAIFVVWFVVTNGGLVGPTYLPSPQALFWSFMRLLTNGYQRTPLWEHIGISLFRALCGFLLGVAVGIPTGLVTGYNRLADAAMSPVMAFIRPIPPIAFIPMVVLYFGLGEVGKIVLIFITSFNYAHVNAHAGAAHVPIAYIRAAKTLGLTPGQIFRKVVFPAALPHIFTGLKVAMALSWAVVVAAELVGAQKGLGFMISDAAQVFQIPVVFIGIALIGFIGLALNMVLSAAESSIVHWKGR
ncbi:MAG: ABC transporter permease [Bradyrhizobium sp.]|uniref:ABC transporter permease n=1 Tax=Bradyrhizobium sp. TaxID=376 RepID=UPI0011F44E93|nr:ABC transporter permease [Bradyrhizobium sp.]THD63399.1 MAG: ABC transporter permease [Bradyrhizobium sp.]